jgi:hypothetical protein
VSAPRDTEGAFLLGIMFQHAGGSFVIDSNGQRRIVTDLEATGDRCRVSVMLEALLGRLHPADKAFLFDAFSECAIDPATITGADEPMRRAA